MDANQTELHASETMLQRGVRVRVRAPLFLRLLLIRNITLVLSVPYGGALMRMGSWYLRCQLPMAQLETISVENAVLFNVKYGKNIYRALACAFIGNDILTWLFMRPYAYWLKERLKTADALAMLQLFLIEGGIKDFMTCTRYIRGAMITGPKLGQKTKRS